MILILAGTQDARDLAINLKKRGFEIIVSVISKYGEFLYDESSIKVQTKVLDNKAMMQFIRDNQITSVIDATHPYAVNVSKTALTVCEEMNVFYIRYERATTDLPEYSKLSIVHDYDEAANLAISLGKRIFLTIGSRNLKYFSNIVHKSAYTVIARVLPDENVLSECFAMGFMPNNLILMQGPFSHGLNLELYKKYCADVIVTKDSGAIGGTDTKISAAIEMGIHIIMIERPKMNYQRIAKNLDDVLILLTNN